MFAQGSDEKPDGDSKRRICRVTKVKFIAYDFPLNCLFFPVVAVADKEDRSCCMSAGACRTTWATRTTTCSRQRKSCCSSSLPRSCHVQSLTGLFVILVMLLLVSKEFILVGLIMNSGSTGRRRRCRAPGEIVRGLSGEAVRVIKAVKADLERLHREEYRFLAIVLVHSYTFSDHERLIGALARTVGFTNVSEFAALLPMIKMVPRGVSSTADAYLTPILREYLDEFFQGFEDKLRDATVASPRVEFMSSDGGLVDLNFSGLKSILSGPAVGVVGYGLTSWDKEDKRPVLGRV